jgi:hypothetical protein
MGHARKIPSSILRSLCAHLRRLQTQRKRGIEAPMQFQHHQGTAARAAEDCQSMGHARKIPSAILRSLRKQVFSSLSRKLPSQPNAL